MTTQRVGLLLDGEEMTAWEADALRHLAENGDIEFTLVISNSNPFKLYKQSPQYYLSTLKKYWPWIPVHLLHDFLDLTLSRRNYKNTVKWRDLDFLQDTTHRTVRPIDSPGFGVELPDEAVNAAATETDLLIRYGFGVIVGDILEAPEQGVLSYHHGDIREYRGRPPGFWEFLAGEDHVGITVQLLTPTLDGGQIASFRKITIRPTDTWGDVKRRLYGDASTPMLTNATQNIESDNITTPPDKELGDLYTIPELVDVLRYLMINYTARFREVISHD